MKVKLITSMIATSLLMISAAHALPPKPEKCPEVSAIKAVQLDTIQQENNGSWYAAVKKNNFGTKETWSFGFLGITADDEDGVRNQANEAMQTLSFYLGPNEETSMGGWVCIYKNEKNYLSAAITPAILGVQALSKVAV